MNIIFATGKRAVSGLLFRNRKRVVQPAAPAGGHKAVCLETKIPGNRTTWLTVGVTLILGVGLVSNLCMGVLIYFNWSATRGIGEKTNELLALNLLVLYTLTFLHVERPLKRLTRTIEMINRGQEASIPYQKRRASFSLHGLAGDTDEQSDTATTAIPRAEGNTDAVAQAAVGLKEALRETRDLSENVRTHSKDMEEGLAGLLAGTQEKLKQIGENTCLTFS